MTITHDGKVQEASKPSEEVKSTSSKQQQQSTRTGHRSGLGGAIGSMNRPMGRRVGDLLNTFIKDATEALGQSDKSHGGSWGVIPLDAGRFNLHYSAAVLYGVFEVSGKELITVQTMLLEASNSDPRPENIQINGQNVEVLRTAMDAWDMMTWTDVLTLVKEHGGGENDIVNAGAMVIPNDLDLKDLDNVFNVISAAQNACFSVIEGEYPDLFQQVSIAADFDREREHMTAAFTYNGMDAVGVTNLPVRSDISMRLSLNDRNASSRELSTFQHQGSIQIIDISGFVDLVYVTPPMPQVGQQPMTQHYMPRFVITNAQGLDAPMTPELFFLGLATTCFIGDNDGWAGQFANFNQEEIHDIGSIGYRMKNPLDPTASAQRIDTKSTTFGDQELYDLINQTCHKQPVFSIDCEDVGPDSWFTSTLVSEANGNRDAHDSIVSVIDTLTGGAFSNIFPAGMAIMASESSRVHIGTYVDEAGTIRDLREIDYLAMLGYLGHNDLNSVLAWEATYNDTAMPIELRLERRLQLLREVVRGGLRIRGFAERLNFTPEFIHALIESVIAAGLSVNQDGLRTMYGNNTQAGNTVVSQYAMQQSNTSGMVNVIGAGNAFGGVNRPNSRWMNGQRR